MNPNSKDNERELAKAILNMTWGDLEAEGVAIGTALVGAREEMVAHKLVDDIGSGIAADLHAWAENVLGD